MEESIAVTTWAARRRSSNTLNRLGNISLASIKSNSPAGIENDREEPDLEQNSAVITKCDDNDKISEIVFAPPSREELKYLTSI